MRLIEEWKGKTDDAKIPPRVKMRVFLKYEGRCYLTGRKIGPADKWDCEHVIALCNGGEHRETNLAPALRDAHRIKTRSDVKERAKVDRIRKRHLGLKRPRTMTRWRKFNGEIVYAPRER